MDIGDISPLYKDYMQNQSAAQTKLKNKIDSTDYSKATDDELLDACKQFEAYFLEQVFKEMEKTVDCVKSEEDTDPNSNLVDFFQDSAIQELASTSTQTQGLGLAQMLYEHSRVAQQLYHLCRSCSSDYAG